MDSVVSHGGRRAVRLWHSRLVFVSCRDRLSASDMLQVRKVMEHVYEKIINLDNESQTTSSSANDKPGEQEKEEDMAMLAEEKIELMCQDQARSLISMLNAFTPGLEMPVQGAASSRL